MGQGDATATGSDSSTAYQGPNSVAQCLDFNDPKKVQDCLNKSTDKDNAKLLEDCSYCQQCLTVEDGKSMPSKETCDAFAKPDWAKEYIPAAYAPYAKEEAAEEKKEAAAKEAAAAPEKA